MEIKDLLPKKEALELYHDEKELAKLSLEEVDFIMKSAWYHDTRLFAEDVCTRWITDKKTGVSLDVPWFHEEMWTEVSKNQDVLLIEPRGFAKTTAVSKILVLKLLLYKIEPAILLITSKGLGEEIVGDIKRELEENDEIRRVFGVMVPIEKIDLKQRRRWRQRDLQLLNNAELKSVTKGEPVRGRRPTKVIVDDPQEHKDVKNPVIANEYWTWFWSTVFPSLNPGGSIAILGTIIANICFVNMVKEYAKRRGFKVIQRFAIDDFDLESWTGTPLWPDRFSMQDLKAKYEKMGHDEFMQEYMHKPFVPNSRPVFKKSYKYEVVEPIRIENDIMYFKDLSEQYAYIGIDTSLGNVGGDYQAISVRNEQYELLAQYRGYCSQDLLAGVLDEIVVQCKEVFVVPERNNALAFLNECKNYEWINRFYREKRMDKISAKQSEVLGWNTNDKTKGLMINKFDKIIREGGYEVSEIEHGEIMNYYYDEKGASGAISPYHDDLLVADMLAVQAVIHGATGSIVEFF